ncbi:peptidoglycan-binding domain-containing protein [Actinoallomurus sp. NPDC052308]|uniref:peptidoglycan-binding domain-containing protein n=1 Tax=Actinoallomurus sp. NPDC052308 TaxID=3155530 RepID=UPI003417DB37
MADGKRVGVIVVAALTLAGAAGGMVWAADGSSSGARRGSAGGVPTGTAPVERTEIAQRQQVTGTLGHAGGLDVVAAGQGGVVTGLPPVGRVVQRGQAAYEVDGTKVPLLYGARPAWRTFRPGMTDGADVRQLESNLKALGYGDGLTVDDHFSTATYRAIRRWQADAHLPVTGTVPTGQVTFLPGHLRVGGLDVRVGTPVRQGLLVEHGTGSKPAVRVQLDPAIVPNVRVGDPVVVTLPDGSSRKGEVSEVGAVVVPQTGQTSENGQAAAGAPGGTGGTAAAATATVTITVDGPIRGVLDQARVQVGITSAAHENVLAVPIVALLARPGGAYEVVVVDGAARRHVTVRTGLFDEVTGLAEVFGGGLAEGRRVEVPSAGS